jgi:hypothetical protein
MSSFDNAKVGDQIALVSRNAWNRRISIVRGKIEKITKTQIVALGGRRFLRSSGFEFDVTCSRFHIRDKIELLTPELIREHDQAGMMDAAEKKCRQWVRKLDRARGEDALALAEMLPDLQDSEAGSA